MATSFPSQLDTFITPSPTSGLSGDGDATHSHSAQHAKIADALLAVETAIGITNSADTTSLQNKVQAQSVKITALDTAVGVTNPNDTNSILYRLNHVASSHSHSSLINGSVSVSLDASGNLYVPADIYGLSDRSLKTEITKISNALEKIKQITGYTFFREDLNKHQTGVIAQDVQAVLPEAVETDGKYLAVAYGNLAGLIIEAIKELDRKIEELKK